jgi:hypothetical protein
MYVPLEIEGVFEVLHEVQLQDPENVSGISVERSTTGTTDL